MSDIFTRGFLNGPFLGLWKSAIEAAWANREGLALQGTTQVRDTRFIGMQPGFAPLGAYEVILSNTWRPGPTVRVFAKMHSDEESAKMQMTFMRHPHDPDTARENIEVEFFTSETLQAAELAIRYASEFLHATDKDCDGDKSTKEICQSLMYLVAVPTSWSAKRPARLRAERAAQPPLPSPPVDDGLEIAVILPKRFGTFLEAQCNQADIPLGDVVRELLMDVSFGKIGEAIDRLTNPKH